MSWMPPIATRGTSIALLASLLALTSPSGAAPGEAQQRFEEGRALLKDGRPAEAIPKFVASIASEPTVAALLNLADCYERIGKLASAHARFRQAQEIARDKDAIRSEEARKRADILAPRLSTITLLPPPQTEGVRVWVDGVEVQPAAWGKPRPYDHGTHEVVAQDRAGTRRRSVVQLEADAAHVTAPVELENAASLPSLEPPLPRNEKGGAMRQVGLFTGGVGVAALVTGAVTGIVALGAKSDLESACTPYPRCPADRRGDLTDIDDRARTFGTISTVTVGAGALLVIAGTVLYLVSPSGSIRPHLQGSMRSLALGASW